jgi:hypothetical protein
LGRGGTGKTVVLRRLVKLAAAQDNVALYVSLRDWTGADYDSWRDLSDDSSRIAFVLKRLTRPSVQLLDFEYLPLAKKYLFVDGLNEVNTVVVDALLGCFDYFARTVVGSAVVISDRLVRRNLPSNAQWLLTSVLPPVLSK